MSEYIRENERIASIEPPLPQLTGETGRKEMPPYHVLSPILGLLSGLSMLWYIYTEFRQNRFQHWGLFVFFWPVGLYFVGDALNGFRLLIKKHKEKTARPENAG